MLPEARVEHDTPGRLRVRVPAMRGDEAYFLGLRDELSGLEAAGVVSVTPGTGSILLEDTTLHPLALGHIAKERGWFSIASRRAEIARRPLLPRSLTDVLGDSSVTPSLVAVLIALAILQAARGKVMVPALSLLMFAFEIMRREETVFRDTEPSRPSPDHPLH